MIYAKYLSQIVLIRATWPGDVIKNEIQFQETFIRTIYLSVAQLHDPSGPAYYQIET